LSLPSYTQRSGPPIVEIEYCRRPQPVIHCPTCPCPVQNGIAAAGQPNDWQKQSHDIVSV
jgi:hypothetical protein